MSRFVILTTLLLATGALAGCATDDGGDQGDPTPGTTTPGATTTTPPATTTPVSPTPGVDNESFALETAGVPAAVRANESFSFTLYVNGTDEASSDHIGAHYADNATEAPSASSMGGCEHQSGDLPGEFTVTCTIAQPGTWHVYGHARVTQDNATVQWWAPPRAVQVVGNHTLSASLSPDVPATATAGQNFTFTLTVDGPAATSDHVGAHFGLNQTEQPSTTTLPQACQHQTVDLPAEVTVTCVFPESGTYYLYGHVRFGSGGSFVNFWTPEQYTVVVAPGL